GHSIWRTRFFTGFLLRGTTAAAGLCWERTWRTGYSDLFWHATGYRFLLYSGKHYHPDCCACLFTDRSLYDGGSLLSPLLALACGFTGRENNTVCGPGRS